MHVQKNSRIFEIFLTVPRTAPHHDQPLIFEIPGVKCVEDSVEVDVDAVNDDAVRDLVDRLKRNDVFSRIFVNEIATRALFEICEKGRAEVVVNNEEAVRALVDNIVVSSHARFALARICEQGHAKVVVKKGAVLILGYALLFDPHHRSARLALAKIEQGSPSASSKLKETECASWSAAYQNRN